MTVKLNAAIVNPNRSRIRGCHPSANRSSLSIGVKSSIRPPNIVSIVAELIRNQYISKMDSRLTHFALPNKLWKKLSVYCVFVFLASYLRFDNAFDRSGIVILGDPSSHFPVVPFNNSSTSFWSG